MEEKNNNSKNEKEILGKIGDKLRMIRAHKGLKQGPMEVVYERYKYSLTYFGNKQASL